MVGWKLPPGVLRNTSRPHGPEMQEGPSSFGWTGDYRSCWGDRRMDTRVVLSVLIITCSSTELVAEDYPDDHDQTYSWSDFSLKPWRVITSFFTRPNTTVSNEREKAQYTADQQRQAAKQNEVTNNTSNTPEKVDTHGDKDRSTDKGTKLGIDGDGTFGGWLGEHGIRSFMPMIFPKQTTLAQPETSPSTTSTPGSASRR